MIVYRDISGTLFNLAQKYELGDCPRETGTSGNLILSENMFLKFGVWKKCIKVAENCKREFMQDISFLFQAKAHRLRLSSPGVFITLSPHSVLSYKLALFISGCELKKLLR